MAVTECGNTPKPPPPITSPTTPTTPTPTPTPTLRSPSQETDRFGRVNESLGYNKLALQVVVLVRGGGVHSRDQTAAPYDDLLYGPEMEETRLCQAFTVNSTKSRREREVSTRVGSCCACVVRTTPVQCHSQEGGTCDRSITTRNFGKAFISGGKRSHSRLSFFFQFVQVFRSHN